MNKLICSNGIRINVCIIIQESNMLNVINLKYLYYHDL